MANQEWIFSKGVFDMKTIEERAEEYSLKDFDGYYTGREKAVEEGYIAGATEQKAIDIEKACEWLRSRNVLTEASIEGFRNVLEE